LAQAALSSRHGVPLPGEFRSNRDRLVAAELSLLSCGPSTIRGERRIAEFDRRNAVVAKTRAACPQPAFEATLVVTWKVASSTNRSTDMVAEVTQR